MVEEIKMGILDYMGLQSFINMSEQGMKILIKFSEDEYEEIEISWEDFNSCFNKVEDFVKFIALFYEKDVEYHNKANQAHPKEDFEKLLLELKKQLHINIDYLKFGNDLFQYDNKTGYSFNIRECYSFFPNYHSTGYMIINDLLDKYGEYAKCECCGTYSFKYEMLIKKGKKSWRFLCPICAEDLKENDKKIREFKINKY